MRPGPQGSSAQGEGIYSKLCLPTAARRGHESPARAGLAGRTRPPFESLSSSVPVLSPQRHPCSPSCVLSPIFLFSVPPSTVTSFSIPHLPAFRRGPGPGWKLLFFKMK